MDNRTRVVNNIGICFLIVICMGLINMWISALSSSAGLSLKVILMTFRSLIPNIIGLVFLIIVIISCNRRYKYNKDDLKIKNNYFFIGSYLIIHGIVSSPSRLYAFWWLISAREQISSEDTMRLLIPNISASIFIILSIAVGIFMVVKDIRKK